jgi:anti-anti-sigma regulatory factor
MFAMSEGGHLYLEGHLESSDAKRVAALLEMAATSPRVIVDCGNVRAMHASVLAAFLAFARRHEELSLSIVIADRKLRRIFELTGATRFLGVASSPVLSSNDHVAVANSTLKSCWT